jgi:Leucine-rich repeat (LRR) protein
VIARWCRLPQLTKLALNSNRIGDLGVQELATSPHLPSLRILDLSSNDFSDDAEAALKRSSLQQQLLSLKVIEDPKF